MSNPIKVFSYGSLLIESPVDESEEQFRTYLTELLTSVYGRTPEWLKFKVGRRFEQRGKFYREFLCSAGSVDGHIQLRAQQPDSISRAIILHGVRSDQPFCSIIRAGVESEFDCNELQEVV